MKLLAFTPLNSSPQLFNPLYIKFPRANGTGTDFSYEYMDRLLAIRVEESHSTVIGSLSTVNRFNSDIILVSAIALDGVPWEYQIPLNIQHIFRIEPLSNGSLIHCSGKAISMSDGPIQLKVTESISDILLYQVPSTNLQIINDDSEVYELSGSDSEAYIRLNHSSAISVVIPPNLDEPIAIGTTITFEQASDGIITISGSDPSVTILGAPSTEAINKVITILKVSENEWVCIGGYSHE